MEMRFKPGDHVRTLTGEIKWQVEAIVDDTSKPALMKDEIPEPGLKVYRCKRGTWVREFKDSQLRGM
jgi:hypothetical protein